MKDLDPMRTTLPHPDHFDPSKFGPDGMPRRNGKPLPRGRTSKITREQAERILWLEKLAEAAQQDVIDYLIECGYRTRASRTEIMKRLRNGWMPKHEACADVPRDTYPPANQSRRRRPNQRENPS